MARTHFLVLLLQRIRVLSLACFLGCSSGGVPGDVVLITVDTLRHDHLGIYGYERETSPAIDRWFADAAIFERAYATSSRTPPSVVSILSGKIPSEHRVRFFHQRVPEATRLIPHHLPEIYQTAAVVSSFTLTDDALGIAEHFDHFDDRLDDRESIRNVMERKAAATADAALHWLVTERDPERPLFLWVHFIDPHGPYRPPVDLLGTFQHTGSFPIETDRIRPYQIEEGVDDALSYIDRYDEEVAYVDGEIGRLLEGYSIDHDVDEALILFTADHAESMIEHEQWFTHGYHVYEEIIRIPLLVRGPGVVPRRSQALTSLIDVLPTIRSFAGVDSKSDLTGRPLQKPMSSPNRIVIAETGGGASVLRTVIQGDEKWVARLRGGTREPEYIRYHDLAEDPGEHHPLEWESAERPPAVEALLALLRTDPDAGGLPEGFEDRLLDGAEAVAPGASNETLERLRALGYVE